ncbi:lysine-specific demethylase hairless isoform X3 [Trachemys scripta elegans]|uniref:lysine-specific demethylase hairless isoform X3 n=1 Tax=Trachemys scripta elegans TaxID=31138 RepID=UPI0015562D0F|nr:lysine-specific demethylase hairless isoform X3 [Trachemys scripta elegans]XP_034617799.1 lysine-specific demethylase hairless isoform X3 [Trachemys scripta elegans]XP_034617800.1 lysine-specific demethylase hairless isoform X3 [Trachemys scripta elegans]
MELPKWISPAPPQGTVHLGGLSASHDGEQTMESDAKNGEAVPRWRRPQGGAQETQVLETVVGAVRRSGSVAPGIPSKSCRDGVDLSCVPGPDSALRPGEKASLWKRAERGKEFSPCLRWGRETLGGLETALDSPYHPAIEADFSKHKDARHQFPRRMQLKETPEFQFHSEPKNGEVNISWAEQNKDRPGPMWTEAMLASQLALYSHAYHNYPLPLSGLENQSPAATGKPYQLSEQDSLHSASPSGDSAGDPPSFHHLNTHCPFLVEAKLAERNPFLVSSIVSASTPAESAYGNSLASLALAGQPQDCPSALGEAQYTDPDWHRAPYPRAWSQPAYLAPHPRTKTPSAFETCSSSGSKEFYQKKDPGFPHTGKDPAPVPDRAQPQLLSQYKVGKVKRDAESEMEVTYVEPTWKGAEQRGCMALAPPSDQTLPNNHGQMGQPLFYLKHKVAESLWSSQPLVLDYPLSKAPARPSESKDESLMYQSLKPGSPAVLQESSGSPLTDRAQPPALSKVELPSGMEVLPAHALPCKCSPWDCPPRCCKRCQGAGCEAVNSFGTRNEMPGPYREIDGALGGHGIQRGKDSALLPCPPSNHHTKLKKTWLTRHSEQFRCTASCLGDKGAPGQIKEGLPLRLKALKREGQESAEEADQSGKRTAKRPHSHVSGEDLWSPCVGRGSYSAKRSSKVAENKALNPTRKDCEAPEQRKVLPAMGRKADAGDGGLLSCNGEDAGEQKEMRYLQSVPCMALPDCIERCCACASKDGTGAVPREQEEEPMETFCRLLHFRRLAFCDSGELSVDGFSTLDEAESESLCLRISSRERRAQDISTSLSLAKYLLSVLGDQFCEAIRRDREAWLWAQGENERVTAWRRGKGALQACDACQHGLFNAHWNCSSCGFQLCSECYRTKRERASPARTEESVQSAKCVQGQGHDVLSLIPAQFIPTHVLAELWKLMHEVQVKFDIESRCPCRLSILSKSLTDNTGGGQKEEMGNMTPLLQPASNGETDGSRVIKEENPDSVHPPSEQGPKGAVQTSTLCELLTSTAVRLCLGQNGIRMAFAPVSPALPSDNRITNILDSIIAQVVERKIQEKHSECERRSPSPPEPQVSHCILAPGGLLWLHDPNHSCNYKLFQEHWRQGQACSSPVTSASPVLPPPQPVLVSGLQKTLKRNLWEPESFCHEQRGQEVQAVNLRSQTGWTRVSSKDFWDGFASSAKCLETENSEGNLLKLESGFGDMPMCRAENLYASLPLLEYCGHDGKMNLASYLPGSQGRQWLSPQICAAYGVAPEDRTIGTKNLTVEATDSISVLVYVGAYPLDGHGAQKEILRRVEEDGVDDVLKERLWNTRNWAGALWHIFRAEDADCIEGFLQKVCKAQGQDGAAQLDLNGHRSCYLDASLRRRLREECGVSGWTLLQFLGDAVLVPTGAPHQVQSLSSTISVTQRFLSPENAARSARLAAQTTDPAGMAQRLRAQMDSMVYGAVREAVGTLQGYT